MIWMSAIGAAAAMALFLCVWYFIDQPPCVKQRVIINVKSDAETAFSGVLWSSHGPWLVLRDVTALRSDGAKAPMDGEMVIARSNVQFLQIPPMVR